MLFITVDYMYKGYRMRESTLRVGLSKGAQPVFLQGYPRLEKKNDEKLRTVWPTNEVIGLNPAPSSANSESRNSHSPTAKQNEN